jgi:hypothetical protein
MAGSDCTLSWQQQVRADLVRVLSQMQSTISFQLSGALQNDLSAVFSGHEQLGVLLLLCLGLNVAEIYKADVALPRGVLVVQTGQSVLGVLSSVRGWARGSEAQVAMGFLINTFALCLPSLLGVVSPGLVAMDYVQNAISVYLFQYATTSRELLATTDFGTSPVVFCILALALSSYFHSTTMLCKRLGESVIHLYSYVFRAWHMLLIDWLLRSITASSAGAPQQLRVLLPLLLVVAVDELRLARVGTLRDVRSYTVFRVAGELQRLGMLSSDSTGCLAGALLVLCTRSVLSVLRLRARVLDSLSQIVFVSCVNVLVQDVTTDSQDYEPEIRILRSSFLFVLAHGLQTLFV